MARYIRVTAYLLVCLGGLVVCDTRILIFSSDSVSARIDFQNAILPPSRNSALIAVTLVRCPAWESLLPPTSYVALNESHFYHKLHTLSRTRITFSASLVRCPD